MPSTNYIFLAVGTAVVVTFLLRALPFVLKNAIKDSPLLHALNGWMPLGIMVILVVYCLANIGLGNTQLAIAQLIATAVTFAIHLWRHNLFLSVLVGTGTCVLLANWVLPALLL